MNTQTRSGSAILVINVTKANAFYIINHTRISIICVFLLLLIQSCSSKSEIVTIDVHKANHLLRNRDYRYLDVRTSEEFTKGHIDFDDALNIPYMFNAPQGRVKNGNFMEQVLSMCHKDDYLVVGCQSGVRSVYATNILLEAGFKHVYNMGGGYLAWVENALPVAALTPKVEL